jgi:hypothetical protein
MTLRTVADLVETRESWHRVAEHVLAAGQFAAAGTIRLRPYPGGFATAVGVAGRQLAVVGDRIAIIEGASIRSEQLTTLGRAAEFAGVELGLHGSYTPVTPVDPDAPLHVDPVAARWLADWFALAEVALRRFTEEQGQPMEPVLWPEHFDLGVVLETVNHGFSPGDTAMPEPYLYVGPHEGPPSDHPFWNASFGASIAIARIGAEVDAVAFYAQGHRQALEDRSGT